MKFAIISERLNNDTQKWDVAMPITGADLAQRIKERLRERVRFIATRAEVERAIDEVFAEEERAVREATYGLGPDHR